LLFCEPGRTTLSEEIEIFFKRSDRLILLLAVVLVLVLVLPLLLLLLSCRTEPVLAVVATGCEVPAPKSKSSPPVDAFSGGLSLGSPWTPSALVFVNFFLSFLNMVPASNTNTNTNTSSSSSSSSSSSFQKRTKRKQKNERTSERANEVLGRPMPPPSSLLPSDRSRSSLT